MRDSESLKEYFANFRKKLEKQKAKQKAKEKADRLERQKEDYKKYTEKYKKALAEEKAKKEAFTAELIKNRTEYLQAKEEKLRISKNNFTEEYFELHIIHNPLVQRMYADNELYQTREEIMEAEKRGEGKINWDAFDRLVKKTREEIMRK